MGLYETERGDVTLFYDAETMDDGTCRARYRIVVHDGDGDHWTRTDMLTMPDVTDCTLAAYRAVIAGLEASRDCAWEQGWNTADKRLIVYGDSLPLTNELDGRWTANAHQHALYCEQVKDLLTQFHIGDVRWLPRHRAVEMLVHPPLA